MRNKTKYSILLLFIILINNSQYIQAKDKKKLKNENKSKKYKELKEFKKLNISGFAKVIVEYSENYSIKIETNSILEKQIELINNNGELFISTDTRDFSNHKTKSYLVKSKENSIKIKEKNIESTISIVQTDQKNYLIQNGRIYETKFENLEDLITIKIKTPNIESILLSGNINLIIKNDSEISENKNKNSDKNLLINSSFHSNIEIVEIGFNKLGINSFGNSNVKLKDINTNFLNIKTNGNTNINLDNIKIENLGDILVKESTNIFFNNIKSKDFNFNILGYSKAKLKNISIKETINLILKDDTTVSMNNLEALNLNLRCSDDSKIKIIKGDLIYKANINSYGNSKIDLSDKDIKEVNIFSDGSGYAYLRVIDQIIYTINNPNFDLKIKGKPKIIDTKNKRSNKKIKKKRTKKRKSKKK